MIIELIAAAALTLSANTSSAANNPLIPIGNWQVLRDAETCSVARNFGQSASPTMLSIRAMPMTNRIRLRLFTPGTAWIFNIFPGQFGGDLDSLATMQMGVGGTDQPRRRVVFIELERKDLEPVRRSAQMWFRYGRFQSVLAIDQIEQALSLLDTCTRQLLVSWGQSQEDQARIATFPRLAAPLQISERDYPHSAILARSKGVVVLRLMVEADGKASKCSIVQSSNRLELDAVTCPMVLSRAQFEPARTVTGEPVRSHTSLSVTFNII